MLGLDLTYTMAILSTWLRLTFLEISIDKQWYIVRLGCISFDLKDSSESTTTKSFNLFHFHNSPYLVQFDFLFFNLYTKYKN